MSDMQATNFTNFNVCIKSLRYSSQLAYNITMKEVLRLRHTIFLLLFGKSHYMIYIYTTEHLVYEHTRLYSTVLLVGVPVE